ncbi:MAG: hypothetical protein CVU18_15810 [Betaproteobacteria bacterium HGW-Betaproteobacteria-12]|nr:MAG: hypothetical protein CVU18_15810 [Betaproteobacteria bacterium HGW-Betaproteobacteria-12]
MAEAVAMADLQARLDALRGSGVAERDPVRFAYLDALARRAATQPETIRQSLAAKISAATDELASRPGPAPSATAPTSDVSPLADLLAYISQQAHGQPGAPQAANDASAPQGAFRPKPNDSSTGRSRQTPELKSVAYFRNEWSRLSTEQQLSQTLAQAPENAGPMNSQHLVLRSLQVMHDIAPDYLHGFMSYIDALIWLEHAAPSKPATARSAGGEGQNTKRTAKSSVKHR